MAAGRAQGQVNVLVNPVINQAAWNRVARSFPLGRITGDISQFQQSLDAAAARTSAFAVSAGSLAGTATLIKNIAKSFIDVEDALININSVFGLSQRDLGQFGKQLFNVARNTASSFEDAAASAQEFARQGLSVVETSKRVEAALTLVKISGIGVEEATQSLTAALNGFSKEGLNAIEIVDKLASVDAAFAVSTADLAAGLSRVGDTAQSAGVDLDSLLASVAAIQQRTARGGAVIGNGLKSIFTRLQRSGVQETLNQIGVQTQDANGEFRSAVDVLRDYAEVYKTLSDAQKAFADEQIAGLYQINTLKAFVADLNSETSAFTRAQDIASDSAGSSKRRLDELTQSTKALSMQTLASLKEVGAAAGKDLFGPSITKLLGVAKQGSENLTNLLDPENTAKSARVVQKIFEDLGNFIAGPGLLGATAILAKLFFIMAKDVGGLIKSAVTMGTWLDRNRQIQSQINSLVQNDIGLQQRLLSLTGNRVAQEAELLGYMRQRVALEGQLSAINSGVTPNVAKNFKLTGRGPNARVTSKAGGYINTSAEQAMINQGVGGARPGDYPKVLRGFDYGGGKKGTVVANTGEWLVPNFGGGDAIFNRDMVREYGLPKGAKRISGAAQGYVPNFANLNFKTKNWSNNYTTGGKRSGKFVTLFRGIDRRHAALSKGMDGREYFSNPLMGIGAQNPDATTDLINSFAIRSGSSVDADAFAKADIANTLNRHIGLTSLNKRLNRHGAFAPFVSTSPLRDVASKFPVQYYGSEERPFVGSTDYRANRILNSDKYKKLSQFLSKRYGIKEKDANQKLNSILLKSSRYSGGRGVGFDTSSFLDAAGIPHHKEFEVSLLAGGYIPNFANPKSVKYNSKSRIAKTDAGSYLTYGLNGGQIDLKYINSLQKGDGFKLFSRLAEVSKRAKKPIFSKYLDIQEGYDRPITANSKNLLKAFPQLRYRMGRGQHSGTAVAGADRFGFNSIEEILSYVSANKLKLNELEFRDIISSYARGYAPNFANPLSAAIAREAAVRPKSSIRINQSPSLASGTNPLGLAVTNTIDEPRGLSDVPKSRISASKGYVPNFAKAGQKFSHGGGEAEILDASGKEYLIRWPSGKESYVPKKLIDEKIGARIPPRSDKSPESAILGKDTQNRMRQAARAKAESAAETAESSKKVAQSTKKIEEKKEEVAKIEAPVVKEQKKVVEVKKKTAKVEKKTAAKASKNAKTAAAKVVVDESVIGTAFAGISNKGVGLAETEGESRKRNISEKARKTAAQNAAEAKKTAQDLRAYIDTRNAAKSYRASKQYRKNGRFAIEQVEGVPAGKERPFSPPIVARRPRDFEVTAIEQKALPYNQKTEEVDYFSENEKRREYDARRRSFINIQRQQEIESLKTTVGPDLTSDLANEIRKTEEKAAIDKGTELQKKVSQYNKESFAIAKVSAQRLVNANRSGVEKKSAAEYLYQSKLAARNAEGYEVQSDRTKIPLASVLDNKFNMFGGGGGGGGPPYNRGTGVGQARVALQRSTKETFLQKGRAFLDRNSGKIGAAGLGVSFLAPALFDAFAGRPNVDESTITNIDSLRESRQATRRSSATSTGIQGLATGALIGSQILPGWGTAIGAAVGGLGSLASALVSSADSVNELTLKQDVYTNKLKEAERSISTVDAVSQARAGLKDAIASGDKKSIENARGRVLESLNQAANTVSPEIYSKILTASTEKDEENLRNEIGKNQKSNLAAGLSAALARKGFSDIKSSTSDLTSLLLGSKDTRLGTALSDVRKTNIAGDFVGPSVGEQASGILSKLYSSKTIDVKNVKELADNLKNLNPELEDIGNKFSELAENGDVEELVKGLRAFDAALKNESGLLKFSAQIEELQAKVSKAKGLDKTRDIETRSADFRSASLFSNEINARQFSFGADYSARMAELGLVNSYSNDLIQDQNRESQAIFAESGNISELLSKLAEVSKTAGLKDTTRENLLALSARSPATLGSAQSLKADIISAFNQASEETKGISEVTSTLKEVKDGIVRSVDKADINYKTEASQAQKMERYNVLSQQSQYLSGYGRDARKELFRERFVSNFTPTDASTEVIKSEQIRNLLNNPFLSKQLRSEGQYLEDKKAAARFVQDFGGAGPGETLSDEELRKRVASRTGTDFEKRANMDILENAIKRRDLERSGIESIEDAAKESSTPELQESVSAINKVAENLKTELEALIEGLKTQREANAESIKIYEKQIEEITKAAAENIRKTAEAMKNAPIISNGDVTINGSKGFFDRASPIPSTVNGKPTAIQM